MEKQESLMSDIVVYASRNKEQAYRRVLNVQLERQRKYEEEKQKGLRWTGKFCFYVNFLRLSTYGYVFGWFQGLRNV